jgi:hypothetical protein
MCDLVDATALEGSFAVARLKSGRSSDPYIAKPA